MLSLLGTEWAREMIHPDIWTMSARSRLTERLSTGARVVINDARYSNDRANLHDWFGGARVDVRTDRNKDDHQPWRLHRSERDRPGDDDVEHIIINNEAWPFPGLPDLVRWMLARCFPAKV